MLLTRKLFCKISCLISGIIFLFLLSPANKVFAGGLKLSQDTIPPSNLHFPITDNYGGLPGSGSVYDFKNPSNITDSIVYDNDTRRYIIYQKIGDKFYRVPTTYTFEEFWNMRNRQAEDDYFRQRANITSILNRGKFSKPKLSLTDNLFNRLFGNGKIDIVPQGNVDIT
ncbi:MAG: hypothetical protein ABIP68_08770, partial [Ferruginibacter sp.]